VFHIPNTIRDCGKLDYSHTSDSTFRFLWYVRHQFKCCWHENLGGSWPWSSNPTAYACLSWTEASGTTWDTLISPKLNLAACSSVVFRQRTYSNLLHGGNKTIEVRGSTNDGATWPYLIGTDTTTEASLPWATNQRNVRIAWIYKGPVQAGRYWCIDDVEIWAKPSRERDVSVSEVRWPKGLITQGKQVTPSVFVWNHGRVTESISVRMTIGGGYQDTRWVKLYPYNDTLLEFATWNASPGTYTATCYTSLDNDECRANDTASLTFRVVADTWVKMFAVYGGGGMFSGACLATTDSNTIFCATGRQNFFAKYLVRDNLWKTCRATPENMGNGAALTYAGGNCIYAFPGRLRKSFYRYSISANSWTALREAPAKIGNGGALAWAGGDYIYALRGDFKKDFYRYSISSNSWQSMAQIPNKVSNGGCLVWTGGDYLYALRGENSRDFYQYRISTNQWSAMAQIPQNVHQGGALAYYPVANKIYAFCGGNTRYFYVYDIANNSWSARRSAPSPVRSGGCLAYCDYSVFGGVGVGTNDDFWRYSPAVGGDYGGEVPEGDADDVESESGASVALPGLGTDAGDILTYSPFDKFTPRFSPNGKDIVYIQHDTLRECLTPYKISATGGQPEIPLASENDSTTYEDPIWSGSGEWVAVAGEGGLFKLSADGQAKVQLAQGIIADARWTDDDSWLIYSKWDTTSESHKLFKVRSDGTEETCILPEADGYLEPRPVTDSEVIGIKLKDEVHQICKVAGGQETWLTSDYMHNTSPHLPPDGQWVTYEKLDESGFWQVYKMRTDGTEEERLTDGTCPCRTPVFSPDGNYIAYTKWPLDSTGAYEFSQICYKEATSASLEVTLNNPDAVRENPSWSPDCAYIVYEQEVSEGSFGPGRRPRRFKQLVIARTGLKFSGTSAIGRFPRVFELFQNRPNPFSATTAIRYAIPQVSFVDLVVYDITGRMVVRLVQTEQQPGYYTVVWHGNDARGRRVPAGAYCYLLRANGKLFKKQMLLVR